MMARSTTLQSKAGYIDARPLTAIAAKSTCNARPDHTFGSIATEMGSPHDVRLSPNSGGIADIPALRVCANNGSGQPYSMATYSAPQIPTPKTEHHPLARLKYRIAFRRLSRHPCQHDCFLRRYPKIPRRLQRAPDIGIFRAAIESNQLHTVRTLHLIAVAESLRPLAERLAAFGTQNLYPVGHEILPQGDYQAVF
jgi:hypothetical protein